MSEPRRAEALRPAEMALRGILDVDLRADPDAERRAGPPKHLVLCFDATSGDLGVATNVGRLTRLIAPIAPNNSEQRVYYAPKELPWFARWVGGAFGVHLEFHVRNGYTWLARNYTDGDRVFLFGFSRGAFIAGMLVSLVQTCGLLRVSPETGEDVFARLVQTAYEVYGAASDADADAAAAFRSAHSREIRVAFLGLWETLRTLGPLNTGWMKFPFLRGARLHDAAVSPIVDHAYHALAIDEHRPELRPALWTRHVPTTVLEQRWFIGDHFNVGGTDPDDPLSSIPLRFMHEKAVASGLAMRENVHVPDNAHLAPIRRRGAVGPLSAPLAGDSIDYRRIGETAAEVVDESVMMRRAVDPSYRPVNLEKYLSRAYRS